MKSARIHNRNNFSGGSNNFGSKLLRFAVEHKLTVRLIAALLIAALLSPILLIEPARTVSAASLTAPVAASLPAPVAAPPESFVLSSTTNAISSGALSSVTSFGSFVASGYSSVIGLFTAPQIPAEFAGAKPISPFAVFVSSFSSSVTSSLGSFFGFAAPSAPAAASLLLSQPAGSVAFDFDGDGKADIARWHRSTGEWKVRQSSTGSFVTALVGTSSSTIAPGDFDGDGRTDFAVFNAGTWTIKKSSDGSTVAVLFGSAGDKPMVGDYDGDGKSDCAVFRPSNSTWYILNSGNLAVTSSQFGASGDIPVAGNYDGDNKTDIAVYRPSIGYWYITGSAAGFSTFQWGNASDIPAPADYDGDGKTDKAIYRGSTGQWFINKSSDGNFNLVSWGNYGDQPVPADYDGDGKADVSVFRPTNTIWYITRSQGTGYDAWNLGVSDDVAVPSAYLKQVGGEVYSYDFAKIRLSPKNATGGTNLYSRNFSWGTGLVGLPGRAGLDAGFGVSYNSLVWTKSGSAMVFDADKSQAGPGFRFGYPTIEPVYYDAATQKFNYLMVTPSGAKVEFRQQAASNIYETADSSYTQLKVNGSGNPNDAAETLPITVTGTNGTQMSYSYIAGAYRCTQIKDANGNFITINNDEYGLLRTVTDTLGRVVTVNYDGDFNPTTVTQNWKDNNGKGNNVTHTYATFNYAAQLINPNFDSIINTIYGPHGVNIKVLQSIAFADGSSTKFDYNSYGQVYKVSNIAADSSSHVLNYTKTDLESPAANQTDCPRFSQTKNYAENFNSNQETVVQNTYQENQTLTGIGEPVTLVTLTTPDGVVERSYFLGRIDWTEALPFYSETCTSAACTGADKKRWVWTTWAQDAQTASYLLNPRQTSVTVSDSVSSRKTELDYYTQSQGSSVALYGLVKEVRSYDTNQNALLKKSITEYNLDSAYISRRIIGLPSKTKTFGLNQANGQFEPTSEITYAYDYNGENFTPEPEQNISPIQHDNTNYGANFIIGRGNLTSATRWNVDPAHSNESTTSKVRYNTAGAVVAQITPGSDANTFRTVKIDYADEFNDAANRNTFAYPTTLTDSAGFSSNVKYRFDTGANVWAKSPAPQNQQVGKTSERIFDSVGRLQKQSILNNGGAYTRYEYPASGNYSRVFSTVTDANNNGAADTTDEVIAESYFDGAGRVRQSRTELPNGNWSGQKTEYYITGQVRRQSVPAEVTSNWALAGDDAVRGDWLWTSQEYDWKGRVTRTVNTDDTDKLISYDGCGCAGGQVTTVQGELVPRDDQPNTLARKTQKVYADVQGRTFKTEALNWNSSIYSTTKTTFNGRDQATLVRQYAGAEASSTFQDSTAVYDGFGRTYKTHKPEQQNADGTPAYTTYNYNGDDSVQSVVDARGASVNYSYNSRGLVEQISSTVPSGSQIPVAPTVSFAYDNIGNRTSMTDGLGSVAYEYNQLSQLMAETRSFADSLPNAPAANNSFRLEYTYSLAGQLKSYKDPYGQQINYAQDKVGRLTSVTGSTAFGGVTTYASNPQYTAWGGLKGLSYGNQTQMQMTFNNRLQANHYELNKTGQQTPIMSKNYDYYADGSLQKLSDLVDNRFDRLNTYDNLGRVKTGKSGAEARGGAVAPADMEANLPYRQSYEFNAFNNMTQRNNLHWGVEDWYSQHNNLNYTYQNNRITNPYWVYDADGRVLTSSSPDDIVSSTYDAKGQLTGFYTGDAISRIYRYYNGDGREAKRNKRTDTTGNGNWADDIKYYIRSSVLGGETITEADATGRKLKTYVRAAGATLAWQTVYHNASNNTDSQYVNFENWDASGLSYRSTRGDGITIYGEGAEGSPAELDPLGGNVGLSTPYYQIVEEQPPVEPEYPSLQNLYGESPMYVNGMRVTATLDGMAVPVSFALNALNSGSAIPASLAQYQSDPRFRFENVGLGIFRTYTVIGHRDVSPTENPNSLVSHTVERNVWGWASFFVPVSWSSQPQTQTTTNNREKLSDCVRNVLQNYFPNRTIFGNEFDIPGDARFINGIPWWKKLSETLHIGVEAGAMTMGLKEIYYKPDVINLSTPTWKQLETIAEELSHADQALTVWASMGQITEKRYDRHVYEGSIKRNPNYSEGMSAWQTAYVKEGIANGYNNKYESEAQANAARIRRAEEAKNPKKKGPC